MSEAREVAETMLAGYMDSLGTVASTMDSARVYVKSLMLDESYTVIENVSWSLYRMASSM